MKSGHILLCAMMSSLVPATALAARAVVTEGTALPEAAMRAAAEMSHKGAGDFSVGVGQRDKIISLVNFGDMKPDTQYPIASASKFLTAATALAVIDEGKLSLDEPVSTSLPKRAS